MLKARAGTRVFFGLSARNIELLREDKPIVVNLRELGIPGEAVIFYGETEEKMRADLSEFIGPNTVIHDDQ